MNIKEFKDSYRGYVPYNFYQYMKSIPNKYKFHCEGIQTNYSNQYEIQSLIDKYTETFKKDFDNDEFTVAELICLNRAKGVFILNRHYISDLLLEICYMDDKELYVYRPLEEEWKLYKLNLVKDIIKISLETANELSLSKTHTIFSDLNVSFDVMKILNDLYRNTYFNIDSELSEFEQDKIRYESKA